MTVSELTFEASTVGFCACCGLRRPLGMVNSTLGPDQEMVRCIDCFFGHPEQPFQFRGEAIYNRKDNPLLNFGQTGDILFDGYDLWFEPHGQFEVRYQVNKEDLYAFNEYQPKRISRRTQEED